MKNATMETKKGSLGIGYKVGEYLQRPVPVSNHTVEIWRTLVLLNPSLSKVKLVCLHCHHSEAPLRVSAFENKQWKKGLMFRG